MDWAHQALKAALEAIRDMASNVLNQTGPSQEERSMRWRCKACQYVKHFTKGVPLEAAGRCPRCKHTEFRAIL
jgi:rubrerythrin